MTLKVSAPDGVKVYQVTSGKSAPEWLKEGKKKSLRKNEDYKRRLELVQDFEMPAACQRIKITPDGQYIFASGVHPPQVRVYDVNNLAMKFDRHLDAEIVDFQILSEDYSKVAFLCADRSVSLHAKFGSYYKLRVPKFGRDLAYAPAAAELLVAGSSAEIYSVNLEEGRFMEPLQSSSPAVNALGLSPVHGLLAAAGEDGLLECFDMRQRRAIGKLDAAGACGTAGEQLTALRFDEAGLHLAAGTGNGLVALFDLRSQRPLLTKDHMYGDRILDIKFHTAGEGGLATRRVISLDKHIVKVWDASSGEGYTSLEPPQGEINDVCVWPGSGLLMLGCDAAQIQAYFVPSLGPAPRWCSFLEGLTEEMEEAAPSVYDDYRFVTKADLARVGLDHLVGTTLLRAYMHGFFVDNRLWAKARALAEPLSYEAYRQQQVQRKLEEERASRISLVKKLPKVNARAAAKLLEAEEQPDAKRRRKGDAASNPLADTRFSAMFEDEAFAIDEKSSEYRLLHPNAAPDKERQLLREHFEAVSDDGDELSEDGGSQSEDEGSDGEGGLDEMGEAPVRDREQQRLRRQQQRGGQQQGARGRNGPSMYAAKDAAAVDAFRNKQSLQELMSKPLAERVAAASRGSGRGGGSRGSRGGAVRKLGGSREMTFVPRVGFGDDGDRGGRGGGRGGGRSGGRGGGRGGGRSGGRGGGRGAGRGGGRGGGRRGGGRGRR